MNTISIPRMWTSDENEIGLQRTCALVDEWSERNNARIEVHQDEDYMYHEEDPLLGGYNVHFRLVDRRYRVAKNTQQAKDEAERIMNLIHKWNGPRREQSKVSDGTYSIKTCVAYLLAHGYSQEAVDEVIHS